MRFVNDKYEEDSENEIVSQFLMYVAPRSQLEYTHPITLVYYSWPKLTKDSPAYLSQV